MLILLFKGGIKLLLDYLGELGFSKTSLKTTINRFIENCCFNVGSVTTKRWIEMGNWENLFLYSYEEEHISSPIFSDKTKGKYFHSIKCFIVNLCAINDGGGFERLFWHISRIWINVQQVDNATFLNLNMAIRESPLYKIVW